MDDDLIRISETVDRSDPLTVDVVLEVHETIASVSEADGFVRVRFRAPTAEWNAALGRKPVTYRAVVEWSSYDCGGADFLDFDAASLEEAAAKSLATMSDEATAITVLAVVGQVVADVDAEKERRKEEERRAREAKDREAQRKEYERLRAMFEPAKSSYTNPNPSRTSPAG